MFVERKFASTEMQFENIDPFFNINTKEDLEIAKKYMKKND